MQNQKRKQLLWQFMWTTKTVSQLFSENLETLFHRTANFTDYSNTCLTLTNNAKDGAQKRIKTTHDRGANMITKISFKRLQASHSKSAMR